MSSSCIGKIVSITLIAILQIVTHGWAGSNQFDLVCTIHEKSGPSAAEIGSTFRYSVDLNEKKYRDHKDKSVSSIEKVDTERIVFNEFHFPGADAVQILDRRSGTMRCVNVPKQGDAYGWKASCIRKPFTPFPRLEF